MAVIVGADRAKSNTDVLLYGGATDELKKRKNVTFVRHSRGTSRAHILADFLAYVEAPRKICPVCSDKKSTI
jgi:hypothetical protein